MQALLSSFDGTENIISTIHRPTKYKELLSTISGKYLIPRGAGLSYCLASGGESVVSVELSHFNRILKFNKIDGTIIVEPGINVGDLLSIIIRDGWFLPVLPGYPKITIGGCIGFNVHGKSQYHIGLFGNYVNSLKIFHPKRGEFICTKTENKNIFDLTIGGFGLTGIVTEVELRLVPLKSRYVKLRRIPMKNISDTIHFLVNHNDEFETMYSWNNLNTREDSFGKGFLYAENSSKNNFHSSSLEMKRGGIDSINRKKMGINFFNNLTSSIECKSYYLKELLSKRETILPIEMSSFPISGKEIYYKLFGRQGLREYQMIIPINYWPEFENEFCTIIKKSKIHFTLGSLKLFEGENNMLNFQKRGICLALDTTATYKTSQFFEELDYLVLKYDGIANISKDSRLNATIIQRMYPQYSRFKEQIDKYDPEHIMNSALRCRLDV